jgi:hypothetical protein
MRKEYSSETLRSIKGNEIYPRTPLHISFDSKSNKVPARPLPSFDDEFKTRFNAVGSRVINRSGEIHLPVLDVDGGVIVQTRPFKPHQSSSVKAILKAQYPGEYTANNDLKDVLGDYGFDLEVFQIPQLTHSNFTMATYFECMRVNALVLRSKDSEVFDAVDSTQKGHNHLYIQREFEEGDHITLIRELGAVGIISSDWQSMVEQEGMGIVRTPWTKKDVSRHRAS